MPDPRQQVQQAELHTWALPNCMAGTVPVNLQEQQQHHSAAVHAQSLQEPQACCLPLAAEHADLLALCTICEPQDCVIMLKW